MDLLQTAKYVNLAQIPYCFSNTDGSRLSIPLCVFLADADLRFFQVGMCGRSCKYIVNPFPALCKYPHKSKHYINNMEGSRVGSQHHPPVYCLDVFCSCEVWQSYVPFKHVSDPVFKVCHTGKEVKTVILPL